MKTIGDLLSAGMTLHGFGMGASVVGGFSDAHKSALRKLCGNASGHPHHRNQTISRKGANIISRRPSHGHLARRCGPQAFLRIFF
jgi:hypothetical protein